MNQIQLSPRQFRNELRVLNLRARKRTNHDWRFLNLQAASLARFKPNPKAVYEALKRRPATIAKAERLADPYGRPIDVLKEMCEYWFWRKDNQYENPYLMFLRSYYSTKQKQNLKRSAEEAQLDPDKAKAITMRVKGMSIRAIEQETGIPKTTTARTWITAIGHIRGNECLCDSIFCSLNDLSERKDIAQRINAVSFNPPKNDDEYKFDEDRDIGDGYVGIRFKHSDHSHEGVPVVSSNGGLEVSEYTSGGVTIPPLPLYPHRAIWIEQYGTIPFEHDIHHVNGNHENNDPSNLMMLPRWAHRMMCGNV